MKSSKRPDIWIGHIFTKAKDIKATTETLIDLGLREVWSSKSMAILELRGGTHILIFPDDAKHRRVPHQSFDLMVANVSDSHKAAMKKGIKVTALKKDRYHRYFEVTLPSRKKIRIYSDHTEGRVV